MCDLSWTPPLLEKDDSKNNPVCNTQVLVLHIIDREGKKVVTHECVRCIIKANI